MGKALALDTPLPTPTGWTTMGEVKVGDYLIDADGRPTGRLTKEANRRLVTDQQSWSAAEAKTIR